VTITADGFSSGSLVNINVIPPSGWSFTAQSQPQAGSNCRAVSVISIQGCPGCPGGTATVTASGTMSGGGPWQAQSSFFLSSSQPSQPSGATWTPTSFAAPQTCTVPSASASPATVLQGNQVTFVAQGYSPQTQVNIQLTGPGSPVTIPVTANSQCQVATTVTFQFTDPAGVWTFTAVGSGYSQVATFSPASFAPQILTLSANVNVLLAASPTVPGAVSTTTSTVVCPNPSVSIAGLPVTSGQQVIFNAQGFRPGSMINVRMEDPAVPGSSVPFFADIQIGPAATNCAVSGTLTSVIPIGRYRLVLTGPNTTGSTVTARQDFDVVQPGGAAVPTATIGVVAAPTFTPIPPPQTGPPAPLAVEQQIAIVGGAPVPQVGQTSTYQHVIRLTNTSPRAIDISTLGDLIDVLAASLQGQGINMSFNTDYAEGSRVTAATANVGTATPRGSSVAWTGQLQAGEAVEIRTSLDVTPTTALALSNPIRGQSVSVSDARGTSLAFAPPPAPQLPVAQRVVQPPPPPVDPITAARFFSSTGFAIGDDSMWTYFVRRGGQRTFGAPISRQFLLAGSQVQLFEKGMLAQDVDGNVVSVNLLEEPLLPYDSFGDLRLPSVDPNLIALAPDPSNPDAVQDFIASNAVEVFDQKFTKFYATYLGTVLYADAFFLGPGDPNLLPGFDLEIWGLPLSQPSYQVIGYNVTPGAGPNGEDLLDPIYNTSVVLQRFQRGVMRHDATTGTTSGAVLGPYLQALLMGQITDPEFADAAGFSPLWGQYNPDGDPGTWLDRPDDLPDTNLLLAFEPL